MGLARLYEYEVTCDECNIKSTFKDYYPDKELSSYTKIETNDGPYHMQYYVLANIFDYTLYHTLCYSCFVKLMSPQKSNITINQLGNINALPVYYRSDIDDSIKYLWFINNMQVNGTTLYNFLDVNTSRIIATVLTVDDNNQEFIDCGHVDTIEELQHICFTND